MKCFPKARLIKNIYRHLIISFNTYCHMNNFIDKDRELRAEFDKLNKRAAYGTAGFRDLATNMPYVTLPTYRLPSEWEP